MSNAENGPVDGNCGFRSGPWVGFYTQSGPTRHRMDLHLTFERAAVNGDGIDDVARFIIRGQYESESRDCWWTKIYPQSHQVYYRGTQRGRTIAGRWEMGRMAGSFCIWPKEFAEMTEEFFVQHEETSTPQCVPLEFVARK